MTQESQLVEDQQEVTANVETQQENQQDLKIGIVANCNKLNIRSEPSAKSEIVCEIDCGTELIIEDQTWTNDFYKIFTAAGIEGFCMKKFVSIKEG